MPRTSGAKSWGPVDVHLGCIAYHSVSAGDTAKAEALQDSMMEQYKAAVAAMVDPKHPLQKYFTDTEAHAYLANRQGPEGAVRDLSPRTLWQRYTKVDLPYIRNTLNCFWLRFVDADGKIIDSGVDLDVILRRILVMAWLKNRIATLEKSHDELIKKTNAKKATDPSLNSVIVIGSLLDSQEVDEQDAAVPLHGVDDLEITMNLSPSDIVACGGDKATLQKINITTAETLFMGCARSLDVDKWRPIQWRAWKQHGPPAELINKQAEDASDIFPHLYSEAKNTSKLKEAGTLVGRDQSKSTKKRKSSVSKGSDEEERSYQRMKMQQVESNIGCMMELALVYAKNGQPMPAHLDAFMKHYLASTSPVNPPDAPDAVHRSTVEASSSYASLCR